MTIQRTRGSLYPTCTALLLALVMALLAPGGAQAQDPFSDNPFSDNPFADPPAGAPAEGGPAPAGTDGLPTPAAPDAKVLTAEEQLEEEIKAAQERIRLYYTQGKYEEAIAEAEALIERDPTNATAAFLKEQSEAHLARGNLGPPSADRGGIPALSGGSAGPVEINYERVPLTRRDFSLGGTGPLHKNPTILLSVGAGILMFSLILLMMWRRSRESGPAMAGATGRALISDQPTVSGDGYSSGMADMPTHAGMYDEVTSDGVNDRQTAMEQTAVSGPEHTEVDEVLPPEMPASDELVEAMAAAPPIVRPPASDDDDESLSLGDGFLSISGIGGSSAPPLAQATSDDNLGIDYEGTDAPYAESQADDIYQTAPNALRNVPAERVSSSPIDTAPPISAGDDSDFGLGTEDMTLAAEAFAPPPATKSPAPVVRDRAFAGNEDGTVDISAPAPPEEDEESVLPPGVEDDEPPIDIASVGGITPDATGTGADLSYNSLMFGADQTAMGGSSTPAPAMPPPTPTNDDMTKTSFNEEYNSLMFGAGEETAVSNPGMPPVKEQSRLDLEKTQNLGPAPAMFGGADDEESEGEKTIQLLPPTPPVGNDGEGTMPVVPTSDSGAVKKLSMFDRQKIAGVEAMESDDFARAVQCLSVAASLKPSDKEVRELLEEARRRRSG